MRDLTRREWQRLVVGGLVVGPLAGAAPAQVSKSVVAGVRIGVQSYSFRDRPIDAAIAAMAEIGLRSCELWQGHVETREAIAAGVRAHVPPGGPEQAARREALRQWRLRVPLSAFTQIRQKFDKAGIQLTAYNISFEDDYTDDEIARGFEMARALGVDVITASSTLTAVPRIDRHAKPFKIRVGMHNHSKIKANEFATPDDFAAALKGASEFIAVNLDIGHFVAANFDPVAYLDEHHARIVSLHVKDRKRSEGDNMPFGEGDTPIGAVLARLRDRNWSIPANIEYEYNGADTVAEVRRCLDFCRAALAPAR
jgi:sugar phosphate isomerase/epimerase